jgi:hypothetical protein
MKFKYSIGFTKIFMSVIFAIISVVILFVAVYFKSYYFLIMVGVYILLMFVCLRNELYKSLYYRKEGVIFIDYANEQFIVNSYNQKQKICVAFDYAVAEKQITEFIKANILEGRKIMCRHNFQGSYEREHIGNSISNIKYLINGFEIPYKDFNYAGIIKLEHAFQQLSKTTSLKYKIDVQYSKLY